MRVFLIDDEKQAVERLKNLLAPFDNVEIIGFALNVEDGIKQIIHSNPEVLFLDVEIRNYTAFDLLDEITRQGYYPKTIIISAYPQYVIKAIRNRVFDYLLKPVDLDELRALIFRLSDEFTHHSRSLVERITKHHSLTEREKEIAAGMILGQSSAEMAENLVLSINTVDTYRRKVLNKLNVKNTQELTSRVLQMSGV